MMNKPNGYNHTGSILIIDDEYANLRTLTDMLQAEGHEVKGATDSPTAFMIIQNEPPDLILLDSKLPGKDGYEVCKELKANDVTADIPVVFLSVLESTEDKVNGFKAGGIDFISKPFHSEEVLVRVATHLQLHHLNNTHKEEMEKKSFSLSHSERIRDLVSYALYKAPERIALIAPDGRYLYVNEVGLRTMKYSQEEMLKLRVSDVDKRFSQDMWLAHFEELKKTKRKLLNTKLTDANGLEHIFEVHSSYYKRKSEEFVWSFALDVTEREIMNETLRTYKHLLDSFGNPVALVDKMYKYRYINQSYADVFGKTQEEVLATTVPGLIGKEVFKRTIEEHYLACFKGETPNYQMWLNLPEHQPRFFDIHYYPVTDPNGNISAVVSNINDITQLIEIQSLLHESETRFKAFMDYIPINIYIKDDQDHTIYVNKEFEETMALKASAIVGKTTHELMPSDQEQASKLIEIDKKVLEEETPITTEEWFLKDSREPKLIRDYKFPIILESGQKLLGGAAFDVTEIRDNELSLKAALDEINQLKNKLEKENISLQDELEAISESSEIIGESPALRDCLLEAEYVAKEQTTVLIAGETGTGKEILARAIHKMSNRSRKSMVKVNCASLPANLIESELFGREKGAYTGAMARQRGRFDIADGSTIFLDEIGDLPLELQSKLLRVLQEGTFERLGSNKEIKVDVRVITATNRDLREMVQAGTFRKDLYFRINVFPITVPPLRERRDDIPLLVWYFINKFNGLMGKSVTSVNVHDMDFLKTTEWPGNVRELKNIIERSMIRSSGNEFYLRKAYESSLLDGQELGPVGKRLSEVERNYIVKTLEHTGWRVSGKKGAAEILGLKPTTLEARMKKLGIFRPA